MPITKQFTPIPKNTVFFSTFYIYKFKKNRKIFENAKNQKILNS